MGTILFDLTYVFHQYISYQARSFFERAFLIPLQSAKMNNTPTLETERLILRKFTEKDMEALFLILKDEDTNKFLPWFPMKDLRETELFYKERYAPKYKLPQAYAYAICLKTDNIPLGYH